MHGPIQVTDGIVDATHPVMAAMADVMFELSQFDGGVLTETVGNHTFLFLNANPTKPHAKGRYASIALEFRYEPPFEWHVGVSVGEGLAFSALRPYVDAATVQTALDAARS